MIVKIDQKVNLLQEVNYFNEEPMVFDHVESADSENFCNIFVKVPT